jgi:predicted Zn finger-like uncharacterized protein
MKITCQSCQAKYTIADEKVAGKTVKIKCKKCSATIVVHGDQQGGAGQTLDPNLVLGAGADEDVETRVFSGEAGQLPPAGEEWTVNVSDDDQRTLTTSQIVEGWQNGALNADTYVWKDGMGDWLPITGVPELMQLVGGGGGAAAVAPEPQFGLGGTMMMEAPSAAAARSGPAAAKRAARPGAVDLFGAQPDAGGSMSQAPAPPGADRLVGERNENSVLFSLSALTATENASKAQSVAPSPYASRAPAPRAGQNGGRAGLDDIMNMTGGLSSAPMLAPPPLLAPVVEAPPPPMMQQMGPPSGYGSAGMHPNQASFAMPIQPQKSKAGLIVGLIAAVVVIGGVAAFFATRPSTPEPTAANDQASATAAANTPTPATPSGAAQTPSATAAATAAPTAVAAADTGTPSSDSTADAKSDGKAQLHGKLPPGKEPTKKDEKVEKKDEPAPKAEEPKKKDEPAPSGGGGEFNRGAATSALGAAAGAARRCGKPDGPTGGGRVRVTFAPSGNVTSATVEGPPFAGTSVGGCIAGAFRGAHIPAFDGAPVSVTKSFSIN